MIRHLYAVASVAVAAAVILLTSACGSGSSGPTSTPTPVPSSPTPAPTEEAPVDLDLADRLYYEGEFEEAISIYQATSERGSEPERREALWTLAQVQYQRGANSASEQALADLLDDDINPDQERLGFLLLGTVQAAQGKTEEAEEAFNRYLQIGGPAAPYAQLRLADLVSRRDAFADAIAHVDQALLASLPPSVKVSALFSGAGYQEDAGDVPGALATYARIVAESPRLTPRGEAIWLSADLAQRAGNPDLARESLAALVAGYPWHARALEALNHPALTSGITLYHRALVLYEHRLNADATDAFNAVIAEGGETADLRYYLGILAERRGDYDDALNQYGAAIALGGGIMGQALWDRALVLEIVGRTDEAIVEYASIIDRAPDSEHAKEGLFRAGFLNFRQGRAAEASASWQRLLGALNDGETEAQAAFWLGKAARALGDPVSAGTYLNTAVAAEPLDYYGLRARALLSGETQFPEAGELADAAPGWAAIEAWLTVWAGPNSQSNASTAPGIGAPSDRAVELLHAGLVDEADAEFEVLLDTEQAEAWRLYDLLRIAHSEGRTSIAARAAARLTPKFADPPPSLLALSFPAAYADLANQQAEENGFSPYLLLALVRQESYYQPDAVSSADATGLTQVIPSTALGIAEQLGETDFLNGDLMRPHVSLRFGAYYLGQQLDLFEGDILPALAAYNGGPGNAIDWDEAAGGDPDVFLETIEFTETRAYVELVLEHYAAYLYAHGVTETPSLPLP